MPNYEVPVDLTLHIKADEPSQAYAIVQVWFNALSTGDFDQFRQMRQDRTIIPSSWNVNMENIDDLMMKGIEAGHLQRQLDEQQAKWKAGEPNDNSDADE